MLYERVINLLQLHQIIICGRWTEKVVCIGAILVFFHVSHSLRRLANLSLKMTGKLYSPWKLYWIMQMHTVLGLIINTCLRTVCIVL